jgi:UDP-GlcNAc:undecaprenyl-phosphate GlcNAc-1-phosphate transferase
LNLVAATFAFCVACIGSLVATTLLRRLSIASFLRDLRDRPGPRKCHRAARSQIGGLVVVLGFGAGILSIVYLFGGVSPEATMWFGSLVPGLVLVTCLGLVDDVEAVGPGWKLLVEILATTMVFLASGMAGAIGPVAWPLQVAWILGGLLWTLGLTNATNFIDGLDGLAAGVTALSSAGLAVLALLVGDGASAIVAGCLAGVSAGFLRANISPARLFLGDSGSLFLGMSLGLIGLRIFAHSPSWLTALSLVLISWTAWGDFLFAILRRSRRHIAVWKADEGHIHHRLVRAGMSPRVAVVSLWIVSALAVATGIATFRHSLERVWASALLLATLPVIWAATRAMSSRTLSRDSATGTAESTAAIAGDRAA